MRTKRTSTRRTTTRRSGMERLLESLEPGLSRGGSVLGGNRELAEWQQRDARERRR